MADEIATLFHEAATPTMAVDPYAVLAGGRRRRRRRTLAVGAAAATAATVAVAVTAASLGGADLADPLPAGRTDTSATATSATLDIGNPVDNTGTPIPGPSRFAVTVDPARSDVDGNLGYYTVGPDGRRTLLARSDIRLPSGSAVSGERPSVTWGTGSAAPHVVIGVLPAGATQWTLIAAGATGGSYSDDAPLPGVGLTAFAAIYEKAGDAGDVTGIVWRDRDGVVWDQTGRLAATDLGGGVLGFVDPRLSVWGSFGDSTIATAPLPGEGRPTMSVSGNDADRAVRLVGLVPAGATDPVVRYAPGCTDRTAPRLINAGDSLHAFVVATCRPTDAQGPGMLGFTVRVDGKTLSTQG